MLDATHVAGQVLFGDFFTYPFSEQYDIVLSMGFIEHYGNRKAVLQRMDEVLKPGGLLIATWPNLFGVNGWIFRHRPGRDTIYHYFFKAREVAVALQSLGYEILYAGPIDGPGLYNFFGVNTWIGKHRWSRWIARGPVSLFNRASRWLNYRLGWGPECDLLSIGQGVFARKAKCDSRAAERSARPAARDLSGPRPGTV
jgi:SAM-dependent methyltransferase